MLLILAGVSIASLTGENGILTRAGDARDKMNKANVVEQAQTDILGYQAENKNGKVTTQQLKDVLSKYFESVPEEDELPDKLKEEDFKLKSKSEYGGQEIEIADIYDGGLTEETPATPATTKEVNAVIGQTVNYKDKSGGKVDDWIVFYASDAEMFLISSNTIPSSDAFGGSNGIPKVKKGTEEEYIGATDVFATHYGETYNKLWKEAGSINTESRSKATAYLCDLNNWTEYVGANAPGGTYAVGGPTKELLVLSWNQAVENGGENAPVKKAEWKASDVKPVGYFYTKPDELYKNDPILTTILPNTNNKGLYNAGTSYWLASPCADYENYVCFVHVHKYVCGTTYGNKDVGVRPLVSIPMSNVQMKNGKVTIGNN